MQHRESCQDQPLLPPDIVSGCPSRVGHVEEQIPEQADQD